jgi:predicted amidohydrolase
MRAAAEALDGPTVAWAASLAREHHCTILAGSFVERDGEQLFNTSVLIDPDGAIVGHYRKVHLFDVAVEGATSRESDTFSAGDDAVVATLTDGTRLGLTICYDLRFPELFRIEALRGAQLIAAPSAFTAATGADHWELLVRARALENQVAVIAAAQWGTSPDGVRRHGHALIVDAWGTVMAEAPGEGDVVIAAEVDARSGLLYRGGERAALARVDDLVVHREHEARRDGERSASHTDGAGTLKPVARCGRSCLVGGIKAPRVSACFSRRCAARRRHFNSRSERLRRQPKRSGGTNDAKDSAEQRNAATPRTRIRRQRRRR